MQVVQDEHQRLARSGAFEEDGCRVKQGEACVLGLERGRPLLDAAHALAQLGDDLREGNPSWSGGAMTSPTPRLRVRPDDLHPRPVGGRPAALPALP